MNTTANLGKAPVRTLVLQLAIPSMTAQFVNVLYSIIDRMYIGHISQNGALALAGAGVCGPIVTFLTSFGTLVGIGGSITMGIRMGEKNHKKAEQVLANSFLVLSIFSVLLTISFLLLKDKLLMWFGASGATFPFANTYLTIYTTSTFFALMATGLNYFINCQGFPLVGMFTVLIGAGCNILSDPIFIFGFHMGISGAAIATVISQILSCIFAMTFLLGKKVPVKITFGQYNLKVIRKILSLGFSPFLILATDSLILIFMNTVLQKYGGASQGDMLITCATIAQSYLLLITSPMIGISGGTQAILSYNYGARCVNRVKDAERNILGVTFQDGNILKEPWILTSMDDDEVRTGIFKQVSLIEIGNEHIMVYGCLVGDDAPYKIAVYDQDGNQQLLLGRDPSDDSASFGYITGVAETANGYIATDGNARILYFWSKDGTLLGKIQCSDIFGTRYPWLEDIKVADDGSAMLLMTQKREDESASELMVFRLTGF